MTDFNLYGAPKPKERESTSSWLHRLAQQQGESYQQIITLLKIDQIRDVDLCSQLNFRSLLAPVRQRSISEFSLASAINKSVRKSVTIHKQIHTVGNLIPSTAFCGLCLESDIVPYLRIEWRFKFWKICPRHRINLNLKCPNCSNPMILNKSLISGLRGVPSFKFCNFCYADFGSIPNGIDQHDIDLEEKIRMQNNMMKSIVVGHCIIAPIERPFNLDTMFRLCKLGILQSATRLDFGIDVDPEQEINKLALLRKINSIQKSYETLHEKAQKWRNAKT